MAHEKLHKKRYNPRPNRKKRQHSTNDHQQERRVPSQPKNNRNMNPQNKMLIPKRDSGVNLSEVIHVLLEDAELTLKGNRD